MSLLDGLLDIAKDYAVQCIKIHVIAFCLEFGVQTVCELVKAIKTND